MEEEVKELGENPLEREELYHEVEAEDREFLKAKYEELSTENPIKIEEYNNYYFGGLLKVFKYTKQHLSPEEFTKFWKHFSMESLIHELNDTDKIMKMLSRTFMNLDCDVEVVALIAKNYFQRVKQLIIR